MVRVDRLRLPTKVPGQLRPPAVSDYCRWYRPDRCEGVEPPIVYVGGAGKHPQPRIAGETADGRPTIADHLNVAMDSARSGNTLCERRGSSGNVSPWRRRLVRCKSGGAVGFALFFRDRSPPTLAECSRRALSLGRARRHQPPGQSPLQRLRRRPAPPGDQRPPRPTNFAAHHRLQRAISATQPANEQPPPPDTGR